MKLIHQGSVKDIYQTDVEDVLAFKFSNRYSIFDWGEMPDLIANKGKSLAQLGASFFDHLKNKGINSHYVGLTDNGELKVKKVQVPNALINNNYDYSFYKTRPTQCLIPLEVIFRFGITEGSSILKRANDFAYCQELGLAGPPKVGEEYDLPIIEFSTKLERSDRYLIPSEAYEMAELDLRERQSLIEKVTEISLLLKKFFEEIGINLIDGKFEFAFGDELSDGEREIILVDSIGPDELRLDYQGFPISKDFLRQYYKKTPWYQELEKAKKQAQTTGERDFKKFINSNPPHLPTELLSNVVKMYELLAAIVSLKVKDKDIANEKQNLDTTIKTLRKLTGI
jgi:phosphoribosylaminoimidazole-succinocarboxamide synthase